MKLSSNLVLSFFSVVFAAGALLVSCAKNTPQTITISGPTMGTTYHITVVASPVGEAPLHERIESHLQHLNQLMSTYIPDSEVCTFNESEAGEWFSFAPETFTVLQAAQAVAKKTDGAFDITVGPLVDLWGFGPAQRPAHIPSASDRAAAKEFCSHTLLTLADDRQQAQKKDKRLHIDLSAIAKGYAVDSISELLSSMGSNKHLVEIGGEVRAQGKKTDGSSWEIALERPDETKRAIAQIIPLRDLALATSGSYRNYFEEKGVRYSHTIDPQTGSPITHKLVSVTVAAPSCMQADAWATALMVLGPQKGPELAERLQLAAFFTTKENDGFSSRETSQWNSFFP